MWCTRSACIGQCAKGTTRQAPARLALPPQARPAAPEQARQKQTGCPGRVPKSLRRARARQVHPHGTTTPRQAGMPTSHPQPVRASTDLLFDVRLPGRCLPS